jgi:hypothetical protein
MKIESISSGSIFCLNREKLTPGPQSNRKLNFSVWKRKEEQKRVGEGMPEDDPTTVMRELFIHPDHF